MKRVLFYFTFLLLLTTAFKTKAQDVSSVRGRVLSEEGIPVVSANVNLKSIEENIDLNVTTDSTGIFEFRKLNVGRRYNLYFSHISYGRDSIINFVVNRNEINNVLMRLKKEKSSSMDEVVVVGYNKKRQSELSSSVSVVSAQKLQDGVMSEDLGTMLQGKVPGLVVSNSSGHPERSANIVIRGVGSIGAGYAPLYVVDGIIGGTAATNDIASITVLKDAAATGLYGSRAANGVIIITTKSGRSGKTKVNYSGSTGLSYYQRGNLRMMNSAELYENRKEAAKNYYDNQIKANNPSFTNRTFEQYLESVIPASVLNTNSYWPTLLNRTGNINKHYLSVSGGDAKTNFYLSGNFFQEKGTLVGEKFTDYNLTSNISHKISDRIGLTWRINGGLERNPNDPQSAQEAVMVQSVINVPWDPAYEKEGVTPYNPYTSGPWFGNNKANYFYDSRHYSDNTRRINLNSSITLNVDITDWLSFSTANRGGMIDRKQSQLLDKLYFGASFENGRLTESNNKDYSFITSNLLRMRRGIGNSNLAAILGQEYNYLYSSNVTAVGNDLPLGLDVLNAAASAKSVAGARDETDFLSYFGQVDYSYLNKYFVVGSLRRDASSLFGINNKWGTFYSIGASWLVNKENFLKDVKWLDLLKIRGSYGTTGNANISPYLSIGSYSFSRTNTYNGLSGARPARLRNPDLTWETAYTTNLGMELSVLSRVRLELDFYNRDNKNLLQSVPLQATSGFASQQRNVGSVRNRGVDINLTTLNINRAFKWETNFNVNLNKNTVLGLNNSQDITSGSMRISVGKPLRYFYMKEWAGVDVQTGAPLWVRWEDENGKIIHGADRKDPSKVSTTSSYNDASNLFIKSAYPKFTGGLSNDFFYKNFSLGILCNFVVGQTIYFGQREAIDDDGTVLSKNQMVAYKDWIRWQKPGDVATHPRLLLGGNANSNRPSSRYLEDASYIRIQNVTLGYKIPKVLSGVSLFFRVDNLAVFTKYSGSDPDVNIESAVAQQDKGSLNYGASRKFILGANINL